MKELFSFTKQEFLVGLAITIGTTAITYVYALLLLAVA
jgi:hypothetical protein